MAHKKIYISKEGHSVKCVHEDGCFPVIGKIVQEFNPELVIELGHAWGGMTLVFQDYTNARIHAYNWECPRRPNLNFFKPRVSFHYHDILIRPLESLVKQCQDKRKKFLYCDGGNKINEVYMYGAHLNVGDMLGVHDYPKEIYHDYSKLIAKTKRRNTREDVDRLNIVLADFEPHKHDLMEKHGFSSRFWIKVK